MVFLSHNLNRLEDLENKILEEFKNEDNKRLK